MLLKTPSLLQRPINRFPEIPAANSAPAFTKSLSSMFLSQFTTEQAGGLLLAYLRIAAICMTLPKIGTEKLLPIYRLLLAGVICLSTGPLIISGWVEGTPIWTRFFPLLVSEISIGLGLGIAASCVLIGLQMAGQIVSQFLGFQIGSLQQGLSSDHATDYRQLFFLAGILFWLAIGGHRLAVEGLLSSFSAFPVGQSHLAGETLTLLNQSIKVSLEFAIRFSLPVVVVGLTGLGISGFASRLLGPAQTVGFGFGVNQILVFILLPSLFILFFHELERGTSQQMEWTLDYLSQLNSDLFLDAQPPDAQPPDAQPPDH